MTTNKSGRKGEESRIKIVYEGYITTFGVVRLLGVWGASLSEEDNEELWGKEFFRFRMVQPRWGGEDGRNGEGEDQAYIHVPLARLDISVFSKWDFSVPVFISSEVVLGFQDWYRSMGVYGVLGDTPHAMDGKLLLAYSPGSEVAVLLDMTLYYRDYLLYYYGDLDISGPYGRDGWIVSPVYSLLEGDLFLVFKIPREIWREWLEKWDFLVPFNLIPSPDLDELGEYISQNKTMKPWLALNRTDYTIQVSPLEEGVSGEQGIWVRRVRESYYKLQRKREHKV